MHTRTHARTHTHTHTNTYTHTEESLGEVKDEKLREDGTLLNAAKGMADLAAVTTCCTLPLSSDINCTMSG